MRVRSEAARLTWCPALAAAMLLLQGCADRTLDFRNAEVNNGKIYRQRADEPFTGKVTNIPETIIVPRQLNEQFLSPFKAALPDIGSYALHFVGSSLCDVDVKRGLPTGKMDCRLPGAQVSRYQMAFTDGVLEGDIKLYSTAPPNHLAAVGRFSQGRMDGKHEAYDPASGKKIWEGTWKAGVLEGAETMWHPKTGQLVYAATYRNGKLEGPFARYAEDGKRILSRANFVQGLYEGVQEEFDVSGKPIKYVEWKAGRKNGVEREWDGIHEAPMESRCVNGQCTILRRPEDTVAAPGDQSACVEQWTTAHRKEVGADAMISSDQVQEWEGWCKEGKRPG